jgi:hypothetical protein
LGVAEAIEGRGDGDDLSLGSHTALTTPGSLSYLGTLELRELVEDAISELTFGTFVSPVIESAYLAPVLLKLLAEQVVVGGLPGEPVPILCQHHRDASGGHKVPNPVHPWPLKARPALARVGDLL